MWVISNTMALGTILMAAATAMTIWVVRVENGGLLNVLFTTAGNSTGAPNFNFTQQFNIDYFLKMILGKPLPLSILQALPEEMGGGQIGVRNANTHSNQEGLIFWLSIAVLLLISLLLICIQLFNWRMNEKVSSLWQKIRLSNRL